MKEMASGVGEEAAVSECPRPNKSLYVSRVAVSVPECTELCAKYVRALTVQIQSD